MPPEDPGKREVPRPGWRRFRGKSVQVQLGLMVLACLAPVLLGGLYWIRTTYVDQRSALLRHMQDTSRALSIAIDRELTGLQDALRLLSVSPALRDGELGAFYQQAQAVRSTYPNTNVIVADRNGQQLLNTIRPWGSDLPTREIGLGVRAVFDTGKPSISNLYAGVLSGRSMISLDMPVRQGDTVIYDLAITVLADRFTALLQQERLPPEWVANVIDSANVMVARTRDPGRYIGHAVNKTGAPFGGEANEGIIHKPLYEGDMATGAYTRSSLSGWTVGILVPDRVFTSQIWPFITFQAAVLAVLLAVCGITARRIALRVTRSVNALVAPAAALGRGDRVVIAPLEIAEADAVAQALQQAADLLEARSRERDNAERRLRAAAETLEATLSAAPLAIATLSADGLTTQWNASAELMTGYSAAEVIGRRYGDEVAPTGAPCPPSEMRARLQRGEVVRDLQTKRLRRDGVVIDVNCSANPLFDEQGAYRGAVIVTHDVTQALRAEERLRQSQKLEAVGRLTGGVAHDFNNLLGVAILNLELLGALLQDNPAAAELSRACLEALSHGAQLTQQLLAFGRRQPLQPAHANINDLVRDAVRLPARALEETMRVETRLAEQAWPVFVDQAQFEAAITNLATNARDAMPDGGTLTISTANLHLDRPGELPPGDYAVVTVEDTGSGMTPEVLSQAFEPFFTTKPVGKGSGLGLSMVFGFAKQSGGQVTIDSTLGQGTRIRLFLPRADPVAETAAQPVDAATGYGQGECVMVVEDNARLRAAAARHLVALGYRTIEMEDGRAALNALESGTRVDLVFSDVVMPGDIGGYDLARIVPERWPSVRVVLTSGYRNAAPGTVPLDREVPILNKPFRRADLSRVIRQALAPPEPVGDND